MKKLVLFLFAMAAVLLFTACDKTEKNSSGDNTESRAATQTQKDSGGSGSYKGNYVFNPPTDNYHIVFAGNVEEARVGDKYSYFENGAEGYNVHVNFTRKKVYVPYDGKWYNDTNLSYSDYEGLQDASPDFFRYMEDGLIRILRAFGVEQDELGERLKQYYIGDETVRGVKCWVFDGKGVNTYYVKYWVDPSNGCVVKIEDYGYGDESHIDELTVYDLDYTEMEQRLYPSDYDNVGTF